MNTESTTDTAAIRVLIERWAKAIRDRDVPAIVADHSAEMLMFDVPPPTLLRGRDAYERSWHPVFEFFGDDGTWQVRDLVVHAGESVAFATALVDCTGEQPLEVRLTVGLRKLEGRWTVVHEHHSLPAPDETDLVVVSGAIRVRPGKRDELLALSRDSIVAARRTPGCRDFVVAADPVEADRVNVYEVWDSEGALLAFRGAGPGEDLASLVVRADVKRYRIASAGPA